MKVLTKDALTAWLDRLADEATLIAPRSVDGIVLYRPVAGSDEITFDYTRPKMSPKEAIFPPTDRILSIEKRGQEMAVSEPSLEKEQVIFGLRPCDAHGIAVFDKMFLEKEPVDLSYAGRRQVTTLIGLSCPQMWEGCFCTSMGGAPDDPSHVDVLLTELAPDLQTGVEGGYAVQAVTENGEALVAGLDLKEVEGPVLSAAEGEPPGPILHQDNVPVPPPESWPQRFDDRYWDLLAERCIGCRICAYVCPTCRCFDVRDEVAQRRAGYSQYDRLRCWDSCTGANYRVVAGGHNPRATKGQRLRNRFFCKFYYLHEDYGATGCVGCGRCIEACPVNIDIVEMLHDVSMQQTQEETQMEVAA
jgi:sulfhydrogenase subunit beta (sulfur reductase)